MKTKVKYYNDDEAKKHDDYCYVIVIPPNSRTKHSCNCSLHEEYKKSFDSNSLLNSNSPPNKQ